MERSVPIRARSGALWCVVAAAVALFSCESGRSPAPPAAEASASCETAGSLTGAARNAAPLSDEDSIAEANSFLAGRLSGGRHYFAQISDPHIGGGAEAPGQKELFPNVHPAEKLRRTLRIVSGFDPRPDFLLITGDLTDHGLPAEYETFKRVLAEGWAGTTMVLRGNHDSDLATFLDAFADLPYVEPERMRGTGCCYALDYEGVHILCLDSESYSATGPESDWLSRELEAARDQVVLAVNHRQLFETGNKLVDSIKGGLPQPDADAMARQLRGAERLAGLLCGHVHYTSVREEEGIRQFTLTSTFYAMEALGAAEGGLFARLVHVDGGDVSWTAIKDLRGTTRQEWPAVEREGDAAGTPGPVNAP